ncbi:hypothetical protein F5Y16DRAFT_359443 [Xylariaceae sp. FL0255]|nr:hypothetical protein F5Y16DRAFT_359443 [Xylariaceae sp. FL0255]
MRYEGESASRSPQDALGSYLVAKNRGNITFSEFLVQKAQRRDQSDDQDTTSARLRDLTTKVNDICRAAGVSPPTPLSRDSNAWNKITQLYQELLNSSVSEDPYQLRLSSTGLRHRKPTARDDVVEHSISSGIDSGDPKSISRRDHTSNILEPPAPCSITKLEPISESEQYKNETKNGHSTHNSLEQLPREYSLDEARREPPLQPPAEQYIQSTPSFSVNPTSNNSSASLFSFTFIKLLPSFFRRARTDWRRPKSSCVDLVELESIHIVREHDTEAATTTEAEDKVLPATDQKLPPHKRLCYYLLAGMFIDILLSLILSLWWNWRSQDISGGFTLGGWVLAVGAFVTSVVLTIHNPHCRCWKA